MSTGTWSPELGASVLMLGQTRVTFKKSSKPAPPPWRFDSSETVLHAFLVVEP